MHVAFFVTAHVFVCVESMMVMKEGRYKVNETLEFGIVQSKGKETGRGGGGSDGTANSLKMVKGENVH